MTSFEVSVLCGLSGSRILVQVEPAEELASLRWRVEKELGCGGFHEAKLYIGMEELRYDMRVDDSGLRPGALLQAVVTKSAEKAVEVLRAHTQPPERDLWAAVQAPAGTFI